MKVPKLRILGLVLLILGVLALGVPTTAVRAADFPSAYTGEVFIDDTAVAAGTDVRAKIGGVVVGQTETGLFDLADNEYYMDSVMGEPGLEVTFEVWGSWLPADETAIHGFFALIEVDLHAWTGPAPPSVVTNTATGVTNNSATLNGTLDIGGYATVNVYYEYGTTVAYGSETPPVAMNASGPFSAPISSLNPATQYHFRAMVDYDASTVTDADMTFTTLAGPPWPWMRILGGGWNIISTAVWLDPAFDTVAEIIPTGYNAGWRWTGFAWLALAGYTWVPLEAFYVDVDPGTTATFVPTMELKPANTRMLVPGRWSLVGSSPLYDGGLAVQTMDIVLAGLLGGAGISDTNFTNVVKPPLNQAGGSCTWFDTWTLALPPFEGVWVHVGLGLERTIVGFYVAPPAAE